MELLDHTGLTHLLPENDEELRIFEEYGITTNLAGPQENIADRVCPKSHSTTLLDAQETTGIFTERVSWRQFSGRFDDPVYSRIQEAYAETDTIDGTNRELQLLNCHSFAYFARHKTTGEVKIISRKCNLRWCPVCQKSKQAFITSETSKWLKIFKHPKILTLTLLHSTENLRSQIDKLYRDFQNLRKRKLFKSKVTGGIWFFQIKKSKTDSLWHPHIHCLITGLFLPREKLSKLWLQITGDSPVCDIRAVKDPDSAARHVARYSASPCDLSGLSTPEITEIIQAMHGRRIVGTWGLAKSIHLQRVPDADKDEWEDVGGWWTVLDFRNEDENARQIIDAWKRNEPLPAGVNMHRIDLLLSGFDGLSPPTEPVKYLPGFYN